MFRAANVSFCYGFSGRHGKGRVWGACGGSWRFKQPHSALKSSCGLSLVSDGDVALGKYRSFASPPDWQEMGPFRPAVTPTRGKSLPMIPSCIMASLDKKKSFTSGLMYAITAASTGVPSLVSPERRSRIAPSIAMRTEFAAFMACWTGMRSLAWNPLLLNSSLDHTTDCAPESVTTSTYLGWIRGNGLLNFL